VRKLFRLQGAINEIIPEADGVTLIWMANSHTPKLSVKSENVPPPKGTLLSCQMRNSVGVVLLPNEVDLLNICLAIKFTQLLQEESMILHTKINNSKSTFML
jgi:hypothetical protein